MQFCTFIMHYTVSEVIYDFGNFFVTMTTISYTVFPF